MLLFFRRQRRDFGCGKRTVEDQAMGNFRRQIQSVAGAGDSENHRFDRFVKFRRRNDVHVHRSIVHLRAVNVDTQLQRGIIEHEYKNVFPVWISDVAIRINHCARTVFPGITKRQCPNILFSNYEKSLCRVCPLRARNECYGLSIRIVRRNDDRTFREQ